ncbi:DNA-binding response regulator [Caulobacter sp. X]|nr:DNA-binding response regulator [Caulobacter sp. X]
MCGSRVGPCSNARKTRPQSRLNRDCFNTLRRYFRRYAPVQLQGFSDPGACGVQQRILLLDADLEARSLMCDLLSRHEYEVVTASSGQQMDRILTTTPVDAVVLDIMLPGEGGFSVCNRLRNQSPAPGVIVVSAMAEESDVVVGLEIGADDYVAKPYRSRELLARIRAVLRRRQASMRPNPDDDKANVYRFDGWRLNVVTRQLFDPYNRPVELSSGEFNLLKTLVSNPQQIVPRAQLAQSSGSGKRRDNSPQINVIVSRLRAKLARVQGGADLVRTVRGQGYLLTAAVESLASD